MNAFGRPARRSANAPPDHGIACPWSAAGDQIVDFGFGAAIVSYSDIRGGWSGAGVSTISVNPLFRNGSAGNIRLRPVSPCIDVGHNPSIPEDLLDVDGDGIDTERLPRDDSNKSRRIDGNLDFINRVDMGAAEYKP
jgi:hypothetical protein